MYKPTEVLKNKILVIDDMPNNVKILSNLLSKKGYEVYSAENGSLGLEEARRVKPDLILLDIMMPVMDGFTTCREIRSDKLLEAIPVIFITAKNQQEDVVQAFESGGSDYIAKPFFFQEVLHRCRVHIENKLLREQLYELSMKDALTDLWNRRYFTQNAEHEFERAMRYNRDLSFVIADIDDFKLVNDKYGHYVGDIVLKKVGKELERLVRQTDIVGRWGGEEFVILFPETAKQTASDFLERIREKLNSIVFSSEHRDLSVTLSYGVADMTDLLDKQKEFEILYTTADDRLYVAKKNGKNRVVYV